MGLVAKLPWTFVNVKRQYNNCILGNRNILLDYKKRRHVYMNIRGFLRVRI